MKRSDLRRLERELNDFVDEMFDGMGRSERRAAMGSYVLGLLLDGERKSIEPIASRLVDDAREIEAMRQRLQQCVSVSPWSDEEVQRRLACKLEQELPGVEAFVFDDTGFPKKGRHSVGVARQYSGTLGRVDNCQVAVSLHLASEEDSACIAMRLYLPESWAADRKRRATVGVPEEVEFQMKWQIAIDQIDRALAWGVRKHVALADAAYGDCTEFRDALTDRGLKYLVGVRPNLVVWAPGTGPTPPPTPKAGQRARKKTGYTDGKHKPLTLAELAPRLRAEAREVSWRNVTGSKKSSRLVAVRVRTARAHSKGAPPGDEQWLLVEWLKGDREPKFYLSTLPSNTSLRGLVRFAKLRWRVERDYQEMKQEIGLDHFEGRTWRGFHHHATLCSVAHGFLALQRALFSPEDEFAEDLDTEMDATDGPPRAPTGSSSKNRNLSAVSAAIRFHEHSA